MSCQLLTQATATDIQLVLPTLDKGTADCAVKECRQFLQSRQDSIQSAGMGVCLFVMVNPVNDVQLSGNALFEFKDWNLKGTVVLLGNGGSITVRGGPLLHYDATEGFQHNDLNLGYWTVDTTPSWERPFEVKNADLVDFDNMEFKMRTAAKISGTAYVGLTGSKFEMIIAHRPQVLIIENDPNKSPSKQIYISGSKIIKGSSTSGTHVTLRRTAVPEYCDDTCCANNQCPYNNEGLQPGNFRCQGSDKDLCSQLQQGRRWLPRWEANRVRSRSQQRLAQSRRHFASASSPASEGKPAWLLGVGVAAAVVAVLSAVALVLLVISRRKKGQQKQDEPTVVGEEAAGRLDEEML